MPARKPSGNEQDRAREAGGEHHDTVGNGCRGSTMRAEAGSSERPCGHSLTRPPAADVRQDHGQQREQGQRQEPGDRSGYAHRPCGDQERDRVPEDDQDRGEYDRGERVPAQHSVADVGHDCVAYPHRPGTTASRSHSADEDDPKGNTDRCNRNERHGRAHGGRQHQEDCDRQDGLHDLAGGALPEDCPQGSAEVVHLAAVTHTAVDIARNAAGKRQVEKQRPVVGDHCRGEGEADTEATGDNRPAPRRANRRKEHDRGGRQKCTSVDGLEATRRMAADESLAGVKVLILTTFESDEYVYEALQAGASGFLVKDTEPEELLHAIRVVARGDALLSPGITRRLIADIAARGPSRPAPYPALAELTEREREIMGLVAQGLSNDEIARQLFLSPLTVKTHVSRAMLKLGARDRAQLVVIAYQSGLVQRGV